MSKTQCNEHMIDNITIFMDQAVPSEEAFKGYDLGRHLLRQHLDQ